MSNRVYLRSLIVSFMIILLASPTVLCAEEEALPAEPQRTAMHKLKRGVINVVFSPVSFTHQLTRDRDVDAFIPTWATGVMRGMVFGIGRALAGVYDIVTFPIPVPANYAPILEPEYAWDLKAGGRGILGCSLGRTFRFRHRKRA